VISVTGSRVIPVTGHSTWARAGRSLQRSSHARTAGPCPSGTPIMMPKPSAAAIGVSASEKAPMTNWRSRRRSPSMLRCHVKLTRLYSAAALLRLGGSNDTCETVNHDTSIVMLERTYSRYIGDHADALARGALLDTDTTAPPSTNVVPLRGGAA